MEFDWLDTPFDLHEVSPKDIEESFEDPFSLRLMPDVEIAGEDQSRCINLGESLGGMRIFTLFWTDGKRVRCILSREMAPEEAAFYERRRATD